MLNGLTAQFMEFVSTTAIGVMMAVIFHFYQRVLTRSRIKGIPLVCFDLALWVIMTWFVFSGLLLINGGEVRFYVLLALALGGVLYGLLLYPRFKPAVNPAADRCADLLRIVWQLPGRFFGLLRRSRMNGRDEPPTVGK